MNTGCSLDFVFFSKNSRKFFHLSLASTQLLLVVQKISVTVHSHCVRAWNVSCSDVGEKGLQWIVKKHKFSWTPCIIIKHTLWQTWLPEAASTSVQQRIQEQSIWPSFFVLNFFSLESGRNQINEIFNSYFRSLIFPQ